MKLRNSNLQRLRRRNFDVLIIGGGINGAVAAAALSARGASVGLIDRGDFAGGTSQHSSNLAWGGIKYMETWEFPLVRDLCMSRNRLMRNFPSSVEEIRFLTMIEKGFRWHPLILYLGTWLYWLIGNGFTRIPRYLSRQRIGSEEPRVDTGNAHGGFEYSDAYLHDCDARFVFNFVRSALNRGCIAANYVACQQARRTPEGWLVQARDEMSGETFDVNARILINAAGPWVDQVNQLSGTRTEHRHVLSKGIHLIVDRISTAHRVLTFFADDGRLFFAIPMGNRTCIGTTDTAVDSPEVSITEADRDFVLANINKRLQLQRPLTPDDVIATRCGVRPLVVKGAQTQFDNVLELSRKHAIDVSTSEQHISIFGGKLTDCINVGEEICEQVRRLGVYLSHPGFKWYGEPDDVRDEYFHQAELMRLDDYTARESSEPLSQRLWRRYGPQAIGLLENIREDPAEAERNIFAANCVRRHGAR